MTTMSEGYDLEDDPTVTTEVVLIDTADDYMAKLAETIYIIAVPIIALIGCLGNVTSFLIMQRKRMRSKSTSVYFTAIAVADTGCLIQYFLFYWISKRVTGTNFHKSTDLGCKLERFYQQLIFPLASWMIVAVTVERFLVTCFPFKASSFANVKAARISVVTITTVLVITWLGITFQAGVTMGDCNLGVYYAFMVNFGWWVNGVLYSYLPTALLFLLNLGTVALLWHARRSTHSTDGGKNTRKATRAVLVVSTSYLLLTIPAVTFLVGTKYGTALPPGAFALGFNICNLIIEINHGINFYLYVMASETFRAEFKAMLPWKPKKLTSMSTLDQSAPSDSTSVTTTECRV